MQAGWLSDLPIAALALGMLALMLVAAMLGRLARRLRLRRETASMVESEESVAHQGHLLSAILGLLALLLAFSFAMVLDRYEARRQLAIAEANAIGTAYLRTQLLDEPHRSRLSRLLVDYAENRMKLATTDAGEGSSLVANDRLLTEIWAAVREARQSALAHGLTTTLLNAVNEVIDRDAERKLAWQLRLPGEMLFLVIVYVAVTCFVVGYAVDGPRGRRAAIVLFGLVALAVWMIADINRPMSGRARESQEAMQMLLLSLRAQPPSVFDAAPALQPAAAANGR